MAMTVNLFSRRPALPFLICYILIIQTGLNQKNNNGGQNHVQNQISFIGSGRTKLYLKLDRIHRERLSAIDKDSYFACVDFTNKDGKTYDIDFFLKDTWKGLKVTETMVHKQEGKERYTWGKKGDFWVKKAIK